MSALTVRGRLSKPDLQAGFDRGSRDPSSAPLWVRRSGDQVGRPALDHFASPDHLEAGRHRRPVRSASRPPRKVSWAVCGACWSSCSSRSWRSWWPLHLRDAWRFFTTSFIATASGESTTLCRSSAAADALCVSCSLQDCLGHCGHQRMLRASTALTVIPPSNPPPAQLVSRQLSINLTIVPSGSPSLGCGGTIQCLYRRHLTAVQQDWRFVR